MNEPTLADGETESLCVLFHDAYEAAAVEAGWETQARSRKPWADVPEANKATMRATIRTVLASDWLAARVAEAVDRERATHRDLVSRLGFGDNITEPMADNDTIVAWFKEQGEHASEWQETQLWRNDCYAMGHPQDDDCRECDPHFAVDRERAAWATKIEAWIADVERVGAGDLRALLAADDPEAKP